MPVLPTPPAVVPDPPDGIGDYAVETWHDFWLSAVSGAVDLRRDGERLRHWIRCVNQRWLLWERYEGNELVDGVMGGKVGNPLWRQIKDLSTEIDRAEQVFGMTPLYKMRLTGALDQAEAAEVSIKTRRDGRTPRQM